MIEHTPHPSAVEPASRWNILWSVLFYALLVYAIVIALAMEEHSDIRLWLIVGLAVVLGVWHTLWRLPGGGPSDRTYFLGAAALWAGLMIVDPDFLILSIGVFAPLCYHNVLWGAVALTGTGGVWLLLERNEQGEIQWSTVLTVLLLVAAGLLLVGYFATVVRQSRERQRLIDELRRTQAELAEAERRAGVLTERQRLARDIHDTLTQSFASIAMLLEAATTSLPSGTTGARQVQRALQTARDNLAESRRIVWEMRPA
ncbi:MAG: sensor histidine kinase, partial [Acidimicrobiia bacterium]